MNRFRFYFVASVSSGTQFLEPKIAIEIQNFRARETSKN